MQIGLNIMRQVGVIGGGAGGLCAARHILNSQGLSPVVWEQTNTVGGTWVYSPNTGTDTHGLPIHSSMYQNLKTNLPKEVMGFPDYPFPSEGDESFIHHTKVLKYLESYADHYNLLPHIKFNHHVESVTPEIIGDKTSWLVTAKDLDTAISTTTVCDALLVCVGHYSVPHIPAIQDLDKFVGIKSHSHDYREPSPYRDMTVVVLGAGSSGMDISLELATLAKKVILSHNRSVPIPSTLPANVQQARGVVGAQEDGFIFADGSSTPADAILFCTGYKFSFPFLSEECGIRVEDNVVKPLYKHVINITHPSMAFIGVPFRICPFPLFDFQVQYFIKSVSGKLSLPSKAEMYQDTARVMKTLDDAGIPIKHFHLLDKQQWPYNDDLAKMSGITPLPRAVIELYDAVHAIRRTDLMTYKSMGFKITGPTSFERIK